MDNKKIEEIRILSDITQSQLKQICDKILHFYSNKESKEFKHISKPIFEESLVENIMIYMQNFSSLMTSVELSTDSMIKIILNR